LVISAGEVGARKKGDYERITEAQPEVEAEEVVTQKPIPLCWLVLQLRRR